MNIFLIILIIWILFGFISVILEIYCNYKLKIDITIADILMYIVFIILGLISFFIYADINWNKILEKPIIKFKEK